MKLRKRDLFLLVTAPAMLLGTVGILGGVNASLAPTEVQANYDATTKKDTFDFAFTEIGDTGWGTSYSDHSVSSTIATVSLGKTSKQSSTSAIPNHPVASGVKGSYVTYSLNDDAKTLYTISAVSLVCRQWSSVTQTITLNLPNDSGVFEATDITSDDFTLSADNLSTSAVKFTFNASNKQIGIEALTVTLTTTETVKKTVTLVTNCEQTIDPFEVDEGGKISSIEGADSLSKEGYHLDGWTTDPKWRNKWHFDTDVVTEDVTLYADWVKDNAAEYTLTFDTDKGSAAPAAQTVKKEHYFSTVEDPTKDSDDLYSYTFAGWYELDDNADYLSEPFDFDAPATKDVELYAKWDEEYVIESESFFTGNQTFANIAFGYTSTTTSTATISEWTASSNSTLGPNKNHDLGNGVTLSYTDGAGNATDTRVYKNQTLTISADEDITKIEMTCTAQNTSKGGPGCAKVNVGDWSYSGNVGTWIGSSKTINIKASSEQLRISALRITMGEDNTTYSNFENAKLQFHYDFSELEQSQKNKIKKATEMGLFVTDDKNFFKTGSADSLTVGEGKIGKKYEKVAEKEYELTVGIAVPEAKYKTNLYAAAYLKMPNGKYYFNTKKYYSVYGILKDYTKKQSLSITEKAVCQAFADYIDTLALA